MCPLFQGRNSGHHLRIGSPPHRAVSQHPVSNLPVRSCSVLVPTPGSESRASCNPGWLRTPYQARVTLAFRSFCLCLPNTGFIPLPSLVLCGTGDETQGFAHVRRALCEQPQASPDLILFLCVELIVYISQRWRFAPGLSDLCSRVNTHSLCILVSLNQHNSWATV